jgi:hypothetical protein
MGPYRAFQRANARERRPNRANRQIPVKHNHLECHRSVKMSPLNWSVILSPLRLAEPAAQKTNAPISPASGADRVAGRRPTIDR